MSGDRTVPQCQHDIVTMTITMTMKKHDDDGDDDDDDDGNYDDYIYIYIYIIYIYMEKRFVRKMWHPKCTLSPFCPFKLIYICKFGYEPFWDNLADQYCSSIWIIWIAYINYISTILSLSILYEMYWNMIYLPMISVKSVVEMCYQHCNGPSAIFPWINSCAATWKCTAMLCLWQEADSKIG